MGGRDKNEVDYSDIGFGSKGFLFPTRFLPVPSHAERHAVPCNLTLSHATSHNTAQHRAMPLYPERIGIIRINVHNAMLRNAVARNTMPRSATQRRALGQNQVILRHLLLQFPTSKGVSEVSKRANK